MDNMERYYRLHKMLIDLTLIDSKYKKKYEKDVKKFKQCAESGEKIGMLLDRKMYSLELTHERHVK